MFNLATKNWEMSLSYEHGVRKEVRTEIEPCRGVPGATCIADRGAKNHAGG